MKLAVVYSLAFLLIGVVLEVECCKKSPWKRYFEDYWEGYYDNGPKDPRHPLPPDFDKWLEGLLDGTGPYNWQNGRWRDERRPPKPPPQARQYYEYYEDD